MSVLGGYDECRSCAKLRVQLEQAENATRVCDALRITAEQKIARYRLRVDVLVDTLTDLRVRLRQAEQTAVTAWGMVSEREDIGDEPKLPDR